MTRTESRKFLPALGYSWLTPWFDAILARTTREESFRRRIIDQANLSYAGRVLDLGCGTGSLAVKMKRLSPQAEVVGLDADDVMLDRAQMKAAAARADIRFDRGFADELPYQDETFDRVISTLFFHHLDREQKAKVLNESLRVLQPGGELHIADWGRPTGPVMRGMFLVVRLSDGLAVTRDNVSGRLPAIVQDAGFVDVRECGAMNMLFGTLRFIAAVKQHRR
jgi:SAM-dependent methyltransferase